MIAVREIDPMSSAEIALVAERMRATLVEVLGQERAVAMYSMDWLEDRVRQHVDPARSIGAVFVACTEPASSDSAIAGHCIVRVEHDEAGAPYGLFSTTYVVPEHRRGGVATALLCRGERWMRERALPLAATATSQANAKLIGLYEKHGYTIVLRAGEMLRLEKKLERRGSRRS
ncbi:MAG: GNAT family N-acetyltransferase [Sandaracinaceae bacterium]|nr:GNAT family N-acetyltransferase [Sandaracinaceae bacterium]